MALILQIACGIVLAVLALRYLKAIVAFAVIALVVALVGLLALWGWSAAEAHREVMNGIFGIAVTIVVLGAVIQYSAKGLGQLFVWLRPGMADSGGWQRFFQLLGVSKELWAVSSEPTDETASKAGDSLFMGLFWFIWLYFAGFGLSLFALVELFNPEADYAHPAHAWVLVASVLAPAVAVVGWCFTPRRKLAVESASK